LDIVRPAMEQPMTLANTSQAGGPFGPFRAAAAPALADAVKEP
jgi:hypothetical protein